MSTKTLVRIFVVAPLVIATVGGALVGLMSLTLSAPPDSYTPLMKAAYDGDTKEALRLIKAGANVNERTARGTTALMAAAQRDEIKTAQLLIEHGADVNAIEHKGDTEVTALMIAARYGRLEMMKLLIKNGADVNARSLENGYTVLQRPARNGETEAVRLLIENGANVHARNGAGLTALYYASNEPIKKLLIDAASKPGLAGKEPTLPRNRLAAATPVSPAEPSIASPARIASPASSIAAMSPGAAFRDCEVCPEMVVIPTGSFMMGWPDSDPQRLNVDDEKPQHQVTISRAFSAGKYEVTFDEWSACVRGDGCGYNPSDQGWGRGKRPVINVSWHDAKAYAQWLSRKTGRTYRLLSEAEWEYVARAGTTTAFSFGSSIAPPRVNYNTELSYAGSPVAAARGQTLPVGSFPPNAFGLHDVHGNAAEWTEDCHNGNYNGAPSDGSAWTSGYCQWRVLRGGSLLSHPVFVRSAHRFPSDPSSRIRYNGVRLARTE